MTVRRAPATLALLLVASTLLTGCNDDAGDAAVKDPATPGTSAASTDPTETPSKTPSGTPTDIDDLVIRPGAIGEARVGMTRAEWTPTGLFEDGAVLCGGELIHWAADPKAEKLLVLTGTDAAITQMFVSAPGPHTDHGDIEVGSTYGELKEAFGNLTEPVADGFGDTSSVFPPGEEDGKAYLGFLLDALPEDVTDDTEIVRIAVTGGEPAYFQYGC
ncbi:MAG: hypothetical protein NTX33_07005 [Propionibacteriales bacterium]|nr:hypothetical protein [Propionibacteriales bacterium]